MKNIITISRQFGAGGGTIGKAVAEKLGYYYCDKDMILKAAVEAGNLTPDEISSFDEKVSWEFGLGQSLFNYSTKTLDEKIYEAQKEAIRKVAEKGNCVIVGRNANIILKEFERTLHVFVSGTEYFRVKRMAERMNSSEDKVRTVLHNIDKARKKYCKHYTGTEFGSAEYYDLCLKSSTLGLDSCVDIICETAKNN